MFGDLPVLGEPLPLFARQLTLVQVLQLWDGQMQDRPLVFQDFAQIDERARQVGEGPVQVWRPGRLDQRFDLLEQLKNDIESATRALGG